VKPDSEAGKNEYKWEAAVFLIRIWQNRGWQCLLGDDIFPFTWQFSQSVQTFFFVIRARG
jgi:hypothetical protein